MGFFYNATKGRPAKKASDRKHIPIETMQAMGCDACSLAKADLHSPRMEPVGARNPLIYILGEAPGAEEDERGEPFVGRSGKLLRSQFSDRMLDRDVRIGNTIRCRPPENRTPEMQEIECCRKKVAQDIASSKPKVVVGTGNVPLAWATGFNSVTLWRGKLIASRIAGHDCWYYPVLHPSFVLRNQRKYGKSDVEMTFEHDFAWLLENLDDLPDPEIHDRNFDEGLQYITGERGAEDFRALEDALNSMLHNPYTAVDIEANGLRPYGDAKIWACCLGDFDHTVAFSVHDPRGWNTTYQRKVEGLLADFLLFSNRKVAHNLGFELEWFTHFYGRELATKTEWEDTMGQAHTLDERIGALSLDDLTRQYFGFNLKQQSRVDPVRYLEYPILEGLRYNGMDGKWTHRLHAVQALRINRNPKYVAEYERKLRLAPALVFTQQKGLIVDLDFAKKLNTKYEEELVQIERKLYACPEVEKYRQRFGPFSPTAPDHALKLMRDICGRDEVKKPDGGYTADEGALSKIPASRVPSAALILEHRALAKLLSTYLVPLLNGQNIKEDGLIHTVLRSMVAETGRLASEDPSIQNFPKRKRREVRGVIVPPKGWWLAGLDYGQIEARVIAMASECPELVKALWTGYDIHGFWADRFLEEYPKTKDRIIADYGVSGDDTKSIRKKFRDEIKNRWVFPQFFGSAIASCAENLQIPQMIADDLGKEFWDQFKAVKRWQNRILKTYEKTNCVETLTGRKRRGVLSKNQLINAPIQGTAADIVTAAMVEVSEKSVIEDILEYQPNMNIHDDLSFYLPDDGLEVYIDEIARIMCRPRFDFINVPIIVEASVGPRWNELEEIRVYRSNEIYGTPNPYA